MCNIKGALFALALIASSATNWVEATAAAAVNMPAGTRASAAATPAAAARTPIVVELPQERAPQRPQVSELRQIDDLIAITERNVVLQKRLRELVAEYQGVREKVLTQPASSDLLYRQTSLAKRTLDSIEEAHLEQLFSREFLSELHLFAKVANRHIIPRP